MSKPQSTLDPSPVLNANFPRRLKGLTVDLLVIVSFSVVVAVLALRGVIKPCKTF
jgi:hypothetical protein